jgi:hypothetical protein
MKDSLLCSPDLRGGGGEGGWDGDSERGLPGSRMGVCGLLGILKCLGEAVLPGVATGVCISVERYADGFPSVRFKVFALGGD